MTFPLTAMRDREESKRTIEYEVHDELCKLVKIDKI
jgi:hypothetical protein